jgi:hypothetical protein
MDVNNVVVSNKASCLSCYSQLGVNSVLRTIPSGQRIAFDRIRGRLWLVCRRCGTWNLAPLENRQDAINECERAYGDCHERYATGQIGLGITPSGLELIRIGEPGPVEFAAWRYGRRFKARRRRILGRIAAALAGALGLVAGAGVLVTASAGLALAAAGYASASAIVLGRKRQIVARIPATVRKFIPFTRFDLRFLRVVDTGAGWGLDTAQNQVLTGSSAEVGLSMVLPILNRWGGTSGDLQEALRLLKESGGPEGYLRDFAGRPYETIANYRMSERLALEMAVNETLEREILDDELTLLEVAWREAETVAAISDNVLTPPAVDRTLAALKATTKSGDPKSANSH